MPAGATIAHALADTLRTGFEGELIDGEHPAYDEARSVWNGIIDKRPAVIARCTSTADVVAAVHAARRHRSAVSIRGGGHQVAGSALCDDGLVIDLSPMKKLSVNPETRTARAQGGVLWGEFDRATQQFGLATNGGEVSTTGIAGFTLGGGMGLTMRRRGLACDTLRSIGIVTADGEVRTASRDENADLFWAARGGGRGIGVVTEFEFDLAPLGPEVALAQIVYPYDQAARILRAWPEVSLGAPDTVTPELLLWTVPSGFGFPREVEGADVVLVMAIYDGPATEGENALAPLRDLGTPLLDMSGTAPYVEVQSSFDHVFPAGIRAYMKSHFMHELSADAASALLAWDSRRRSPSTIVALRTMGGRVGAIAADDSAYAHRSAAFNLSLDACWWDRDADAAEIGWCRAGWEAMRPYSTGGVYVNFSGFGADEEGLDNSIYGRNHARLEEIRRRHDPDGVFAAAARRA